MPNIPSISMKHEDCYILCQALVRRANKEGTQILSIWSRYSKILKVCDSKMRWTWKTLFGSRSYRQAAWVYELANSRSASTNRSPSINPLLFKIQQPTGHGSDPRGNHNRNPQIGEKCCHRDSMESLSVEHGLYGFTSLDSRQREVCLHCTTKGSMDWDAFARSCTCVSDATLSP